MNLIISLEDPRNYLKPQALKCQGSPVKEALKEALKNPLQDLLKGTLAQTAGSYDEDDGKDHDD